ncbi:Hypothetical Protein PANA_1028 [Pantoea ananatis LMG 20103]|uniref:Uncharacterized protein n=1 Tax=Pantoea ananatis (strain LMG 20103) TaxID=706191 RepID=D4GLS5_PANAM|nr:Hypothetical Protein PANA_1028 [Pantoea ananatis LMG 20103]
MNRERCAACGARGRKRGLVAGKIDQAVAVNAQRLETRFTCQIEQVDNKCRVLNFAACTTNQFDGRFERAPRCQQVVDHQHHIAWLNSIFVQFQSVGTVFQLVSFAEGFTWQFARLAHRNKAQPQSEGDRCPEQETPRFRAHHFGDAFIAITLYQQRDGRGIGFWVFQQAGDVTEKNTRLRVIRNTFDTVFNQFKLLRSVGHNLKPGKKKILFCFAQLQ